MAGAYNQARLDVANHQANVRTQATAMENEKNNIAWNFVANSAEQLAELGAGAFNDHVDRKLEEYLSTQTEEVTDGYYYTVDDYGNRVINSSVDEVKKNAMANADEWINNNVGFGKDLLRKKIQRSVDLNTANYESQLKAKAISANTSAVENTKNKYLNNWDFSGTDVLELTKSIVDNYEVTMGKTFSVGDYGYNLYQDILNSSNDPNDAGNVFIKVAKLDIIMKAKSLNMSDSYIQSYMEGKQVEKELSLSYAAYSAVNDPTTGFIESVINSNYDQETAIAKYLGNEIDNVKKNGITDSNGNVIYLSEEELAAYETKVKSLYSTVITEWNYEAANAWEGISKGLEELYKNPDPYNNTELANITSEDEWANLIFSYAPQGMKHLSVENIKKTSWYKSLRPYAMEMIEGNKNYNLLIKAQNFNQKEFATPIARLTAWQEEIKGYSEQEKLLLSKLGAGDINVLYDDNYSDITRETFMSAYAPSLTAQFSSGMQSNLLEDVYNSDLQRGSARIFEDTLNKSYDEIKTYLKSNGFMDDEGNYLEAFNKSPHRAQLTTIIQNAQIADAQKKEKEELNLLQTKTFDETNGMTADEFESYLVSKGLWKDGEPTAAYGSAKNYSQLESIRQSVGLEAKAKEKDLEYRKGEQHVYEILKNVKTTKDFKAVLAKEEMTVDEYFDSPYYEIYESTRRQLESNEVKDSENSALKQQFYEYSKELEEITTREEYEKWKQDKQITDIWNHDQFDLLINKEAELRKGERQAEAEAKAKEEEEFLYKTSLDMIDLDDEEALETYMSNLSEDEKEVVLGLYRNKKYDIRKTKKNKLQIELDNRLAEERKLNLQNVENSVKQWVMSHPRFTLEELSNHLDTYNISELDKSIFYGAYLSTGQVNDFANKAVEHVSILFDLPEDKDGYKILPPREEIEKAIDSIEEPVVKDYLNALYKADPSLYFLTGEEDEVLEKIRAVGVSYFGSNKTEFNNFIKENNDNIAAAIKAQSDYTWAKDFVSNEDKIKYGYLSTESEYVTPEELASYITINAVDSEGEDYDIGSDEYIEYISRTFFGEGKTFSEEELAELKDCTSEIEVKSFLMGAEGSQYNIQDAINVYTKYAEEDIPEEVKIMRDDAVKMAEYQMGRKALDNDVRNKKIHVGQASVSNSEYGKASLWTQKELNDAGENGALFTDIRNSLYETEYGSADYLLVQQKLQNNKYNLTKDAYDKLNALANSDLDSLAINMAKAFNIAGLENISIKEKLKEKYTASYGSNDFENFWEYMLNHNSSVIDKMGDAIKAYPDDAKSIDNFCTEIMVGYAASFAMHGTSTDRFNTITYDGNHFIVEDSIKKDSGTVKEVKHGWFGKEKVKDIETTPDNFYDALSTSINSKSYQGPSDYDKYLFSTVNKNDSRVAALFSMLETGTIPQYKDDKVSDRIITATAIEIATFMHTGHTNGLNVSKFGGKEYAGEISKQFYSLQRFYAENPTQSNAIMNTAAYIIQSYNSIFKDKSSLPQGLGNFYFDKDGRVYSYEKNCPLSYESDGLNATITHKDAATGEDTERIIALDMFRNDVKAKDVIQYIEIDSKYIAPINGSKVSMEGVLENFSAIQEYNENCELLGSRLRLVPIEVASHLPEEYGINEKMTYVKFKIVGLDDIDKYRKKDYWEKYNFESLISTSSRKGDSRNI